MNFMNTLSFLECNLLGSGNTANNKLVSAIHITVLVVQILQVAVPIGLIIWGTLDFGKAVIEGDEKKMKEKRKPFIQRVISAVIVFLIPWFVGVVLGNVGGSEWKQCWKAGREYDGESIFSSTRDPLDVGGETDGTSN